ncbi:MAG: helix-hairpin-helix domain-containing protein [Gemmatimonadales bacterium]
MHESSTELERIPGVGPSIARDLQDLGIRELQDLRDRDPEELYQRLCSARGAPVDRCVLYVFRCAVYFVSTERHDPALLKWWNWKDRD